MKKMTLIGMMLGILVALSSLSYAAFPEKPIQIVCPFAAGGETDLILRIIASTGTPHFGQSIVVVNKTGGGTSLGMQYAATAKPDGYTIVGGSLATLLMHPLMDKMPYSYKDFDMIGQYAITQAALYSKLDAPWKDFQGFIKYAKEHPGEIKYGSAGAGTTGHLLMESISAEAGGLKMVHIPYAGAAPALTSLAGGHIYVSTGDVAPAMPLVEAKKIIPLVTINSQRVKSMPNLPALPELGHRSLDVWKALLIPKGAPPAVLTHLEKALEATLKDKNCIDALAKIGQEPDFIGSQKFTSMMLDDNKWLSNLVDKLGLAKK